MRCIVLQLVAVGVIVTLRLLFLFLLALHASLGQVMVPVAVAAILLLVMASHGRSMLDILLENMPFLLLLDPVVLGQCGCVMTGHVGHTQGCLRVDLLTEDLTVILLRLRFVLPVHLVVAFVALNRGIQRARAQEHWLLLWLHGGLLLWLQVMLGLQLPGRPLLPIVPRLISTSATTLSLLSLPVMWHHFVAPGCYRWRLRVFNVAPVEVLEVREEVQGPALHVLRRAKLKAWVAFKA